MITNYYIGAFIASFVLTIIYTYRWHKHFNVYFTLVFTLIPLVNLGYVLLALSQHLDAALAAQKIIYIGGCFLLFFITMSIFSLCQIEISKLYRTLTIIFITAVYFLVLTIGYLPVFYRNVSFEIVDGQGVLRREYGPAHTIFYIMVITFFLVSFITIIYSYLKKKQVSRNILILLFIPEIVSFICYLGRHAIMPGAELIPASYVFAQVMYLLIARRICLYDLTETITDSIMQAREIGFISVDFHDRYLGSSEVAKSILPELMDLTVDHPASVSPFIKETLLDRLDSFRSDESRHQFYFQREDGSPIYAVNIQYLYDDRKRKGYQFVFTDDTKNQKYISLLNTYNADLEREVQKKTENLIEMHNSFILGMATMVESRDNSTGGHIRRTSEGVRLLVAEMKKDGDCAFSETFCQNLIKAAPMHDLGKIAVDDAILRKPGSFTPDEMEQMKSHAAEGARIVHEILKDTDDTEFRILAENVAHYHHEHFDGSGYPEGLAGEAIPIEARIMAIADVYDALVCKRVYKDAMPFDKADAIIMDGMGRHFDPALQKYYTAARPALEAYYAGAGGVS